MRESSAPRRFAIFEQDANLRTLRTAQDSIELRACEDDSEVYELPESKVEEIAEWARRALDSEPAGDGNGEGAIMSDEEAAALLQREASNVRLTEGEIIRDEDRFDRNVSLTAVFQPDADDPELLLTLVSLSDHPRLFGVSGTDTNAANGHFGHECRDLDMLVNGRNALRHSNLITRVDVRDNAASITRQYPVRRNLRILQNARAVEVRFCNNDRWVYSLNEDQVATLRRWVRQSRRIW